MPVADTHILAGSADGVVIVVRARQTPRNCYGVPSRVWAQRRRSALCSTTSNWAIPVTLMPIDTSRDITWLPVSAPPSGDRPESEGPRTSARFQAALKAANIIVDVCLVNSGIRRTRVSPYWEAGSMPVRCDPRQIESLGAIPIQANLMAKREPKIRHDDKMLGRLVVTTARSLMRARAPLATGQTSGRNHQLELAVFALPARWISALAPARPRNKMTRSGTQQNAASRPSC